jgi:hypothetical protein
MLCFIVLALDQTKNRDAQIAKLYNAEDRSLQLLAMSSTTTHKEIHLLQGGPSED